MSWTIVIAFTVVLILTILGMVGVIRFRYKEHLNKLFTLLLLEVVSMGFLVYKQGVDKQNQYFISAQMLFNNAKEKAEKKEYDFALNDLSEIFRLSDRDIPFSIKDAFRLRGNIYFNRNMWPDAIAAYRFYLEIEPNDDQALSRLGRSLREMHQYEEAKRVYEKAHSLSPHDYYILNGLQNCLRRYGGFLQEAERIDAAEKTFEQARQYIIDMINVAKTSKDNNDENKLLNAKIALARLNWEWERLAEAIALFEELEAEYPNFAAIKEDLAAIYLEYGQREDRQYHILKSLSLYSQIYNSVLDELNKVFIGSGIAEATAFISQPTQDQIEFAKKRVLLSIAKNEKARDDPYPFYAAAVLFKKINNNTEANEYIKKAIKAEKRRAENPYTFDYKRLKKYEKLYDTWSQNQNS
jgi:tetratricopeptide (TPR) repeat protein